MIVGWKSIAINAGVHLRTVKRWHYQRAPIPFFKTTPSKQGKVMVDEQDLKAWLKNMSATMSRL